MSHSTLLPTDSAELRAHAARAAQARREGVRLLRDARDGRHYATSATKPGVRYFVTLASCTCLGFVRHGHCKHHSALVIAHLLQEQGPQTPTPERSGMTVVRTAGGVQLGMTYQRPDGWWSVFVATPDGNYRINDRGSERAAVNAIWEYADRHPLVLDPAEDPGMDAYAELIAQRAA